MVMNKRSGMHGENQIGRKNVPDGMLTNLSPKAGGVGVGAGSGRRGDVRSRNQMLGKRKVVAWSETRTLVLRVSSPSLCWWTKEAV